MANARQLRTVARSAGVPAAAGRYESFFLKAVRPGGGLGVWIRYTVNQPPAAPVTASLWLTVFDAAADGPWATKVTYGSTDLSFPAGAYVRIRDSILKPGMAQGSLSGTPTDATWDLTFPDGAAAFAHLPYRWMYESGFPRTKVESIYPTTRFAGQITIGDRLIDVSGWPGMIGHNWGGEHAERWIWIQASELDPRGTHLDVAAGKILVAGRTSPWLANGLLAMDGEMIRLGGPGRIRATTFHESPNRCVFSVAGSGVVVSGRVSARQKDFASWVYQDPAGGEHQCLNCSISDIELSIRQRGGLRYLSSVGSAPYLMRPAGVSSGRLWPAAAGGSALALPGSHSEAY